MKRFYGVVMLLLFLCTAPGYSQITIPQNTIHNLFIIGDTLDAMVSSDTSTNIGKKGGPNTYDFSSMNYINTKVTIVSGATVPLIAAHFQGDTAFSTPEGYQIETFADSGMINPGKIITVNDSTYDVNTKVPGEVVFKFPLAYNETWSYGFLSYDSIFTNGNLDSTRISNPNDRITTVDGYGTLIIPGGNTYQCLRIAQEPQVPGTANNSIFFVTQNGTFVVIDADRIEADTGLIGINGFQIIESNAVSAVRQNKIAPSTFSLLQNYPNPFNPTTKIGFRISHSGFVTLKIYDALGREVADLVNENKSPGVYSVNFNASELPSGIYFYRLEEGDLIQTRKMALLR